VRRILRGVAQSRLRPKQRWLRVVLWFAALFALLFLVRDQLGPVLTLIAGLLLFAAGIGFVIAPLARRHAGRAGQADEHLLHRRSFLIGLAVSAAGVALTVYGIYRVVEHAISIAS
jgi:FtsH-binding integral membrane protein